jgi:hypothetical protein
LATTRTSFAIPISRLHTDNRSVVAGCNGADSWRLYTCAFCTNVCVCGICRWPTSEALISRRSRWKLLPSVWQRPKDVRIFQKTAFSFVSTYKWGVQKGSKKGLFGVSASYGINRSHRMQNSPPQFSLKCGVFEGFWPFLGTPPQWLVLRPQGIKTI